MHGQGIYAGSYYRSTRNLQEEALKTALHNLISNHASLGYNTARDKMFMLIDNQKVNGKGAITNTLEGVYSRQLCTGYSNRSQAQNNCGFNTEHTFPQSYFNRNEPMKSDLYHLFPSLATPNAKRANYPFGEVLNPSWQSGGSKLGMGVFEPLDAQKGVVARALFYFVICYQNYSHFVQGQEKTLRRWAVEFPPDSVELIRNNAIANLQHNRNPFIDHLEFLERISSITSKASAPVIHELQYLDDTIQFERLKTGKTYSYTYYFYDLGDSQLQISNVHFSDASFQLDSFSAHISPGNAGYITFNFWPKQGETLSATLSFETNDTLHDHVSIPIEGQVT